MTRVRTVLKSNLTFNIEQRKFLLPWTPAKNGTYTELQQTPLAEQKRGDLRVMSPLVGGSTPIPGFKNELMTNQSHEKNRKRGSWYRLQSGNGCSRASIQHWRVCPPLLFGTQEARSLRASLNARLKRFYIRFPSEFWLSFSWFHCDKGLASAVYDRANCLAAI